MSELVAHEGADTILVLGAEGLVGRKLRQCLAARFRLVSVDVRPLHPVRAQVGARECRTERLVRADLGDPAQIDQIWERVAPSEFERVAAVFHLAAHYDFRNRPDPRYDRLQGGLDHLLARIDASVPAQAPLVYASSMASLAPTEPGRRQTEDDARLGAWQYPASKIAAEDLLRAAELDRPVVELVLAAIYTDLCELVPLFQTIELEHSRSPTKYVYPGPVDRGLTYVHLEEVARAFELAAAKLRGRPGCHRFLIGQAEPVTYAQIHRQASRAFYGKVLPLVRIPAALAYVGAALRAAVMSGFGRRPFIQPWMIWAAGEHFEFDLTHTRRKLGWEPSRWLGEDLSRILQLAAYHRQIWLEVNQQRPW